MIGFNNTHIKHPGLFLLISIVTSLAGGGMGLALGTMVPDGKLALALAPLIF